MIPRILQAWLRNMFATYLIYFGVGGGWSYYIYWVFGFRLFKSDEIPAFRDVSEQMKVIVWPSHMYAQGKSINLFCNRGLRHSLSIGGSEGLADSQPPSALFWLGLVLIVVACTCITHPVKSCSAFHPTVCMKIIPVSLQDVSMSEVYFPYQFLFTCQVAACSIPLYAALPALTEWVVENGYTLAYSRISDVGLAKYIAYFVLYMTSVEFCVYWQHRNLHDIKWGYR